MGLRVVCPNCGSRPFTEFWFGGEVLEDSSNPDPLEADYERVWLKRNMAGLQSERWYHFAGCRRWFTAHRDTTRNEFHAQP